MENVNLTCGWCSLCIIKVVDHEFSLYRWRPLLLHQRLDVVKLPMNAAEQHDFTSPFKGGGQRIMSPGHLDVCEQFLCFAVQSKLSDNATVVSMWMFCGCWLHIIVFSWIFCFHFQKITFWISIVRVAATCIVTRVTVNMVTSAVPQEDAADWFGFDLTEHHGHFGGLEGFNSFGRKPGKKKYIKVLLLQGNNIVKHLIPVYSNFKFKYVKYFFLKISCGSRTQRCYGNGYLFH